MAKISELADGGNLLNDDELIVLRAGGNVRATVANLPEVDASGNQSFADGEKVTFGTGSDLQIYHDGSNSFIQDSGTGDLIVRASDNLYLQSYSGAENYLTATTNGAVTAYYDNAAKLATTSTGVDVTGNTESDTVTIGTSSVLAGSEKS